MKSQPYTAKSDIWSIGLLFYEMLFGKTPWPCRDIKSLLYGITNQPLRFPYDKQILKETKELISKCLQIEEVDRISWE